MALIKNTLGKRSLGIQYKIVSSGTASAVDLGALSDDVEVVNLPGHVVISDIHVVTDTAFDGTAPTVDVELLDLDGADLVPPLVLAAAVDVSAAGRTSAAVTAAETLVPTLVTVKNSAADSTVGNLHVEIEYYVFGRSNENEG